MTGYLDDRGALVEVAHGLGGSWIVARRGSSPGSHHRVKSPWLPPRISAELCQRDLDAYAARKGWRREISSRP